MHIFLDFGILLGFAFEYNTCYIEFSFISQ